jgi:tetratricopeptide (TPR) repeat protein
MGRIILILILTFHVSYPVHSQQEFNFIEINRVTFELYQAGAWKELISTGEKALKGGIDYFYLRMRLGIASYETGDYSRAIRHFTRALEFNSTDDTAMEYLYFAYRLYGRDMEAHNVSRGFSGSLKNKLSYRRNVIRSFSLNATGSFLQDAGIIDNYSYDDDREPDGFQSVTRDFMYFGASLEHDAGRLLKLTHSPGMLSKSYLLYTRDETQTELTRDARLSQFQYYVSGRLLLGNGAYLIPAIHYLAVRIPYETTVAGRFGRTFRMQQHYFNHDVATSLGLEKYYGKVRPGITAGYSYINRHPHLQGSFTFSWFPHGNLNLYSISDITLYSPLSGDDTNGKRILSQEIGFRTFPWLWVELSGSWGERENFAGARAYLVYNDPMVIRERYGITIISPFNGAMELTIHYGYYLKESRFTADSAVGDVPVNPIELNTHKISGGIKWNF